MAKKSLTRASKARAPVKRPAAKASKPAANAKQTTPERRARAPRAGEAEALLVDLKARLAEISELSAAAGVLSWDQATYMPAGGAAARGRQLSRLSELIHTKRTDAAIGRLLDRLEPYGRTLPDDHDDAALLRVLRRDYEQSIRVPASFVARASAHYSAAYQNWTEARPANDFGAVRAGLEIGLNLSREYAGYFSGHAHIMDPLIGPDEGLTAAETRTLFAALRAELVPLVKAITAHPPADDRCLRQRFPEPQQIAFATDIAEAFGYDLKRGRIDKTAHPFCTTFARDDVRITTRVQETDLSDALFSTLHEAGHALYEMGVDRALEGTPLAHGTSAGVHESQSRLWENLVARSRRFWEHQYPRLQATFPDQLRRVPLDAFYRAINKVDRTLIRTDADEVTYNLHVMIRFDLECDLLEGKLAIRDLPEAWRARYVADLGVAPLDDKDGVLQDVHWYAGGIGGMFQSYTIGNVLSAQLFDAAIAAHPGIPAEIRVGRFATLHDWLRENVYRHGRKLAMHDLIVRATGKGPTIAPYMRYLKTKYGELYDLRAA